MRGFCLLVAALSICLFSSVGKAGDFQLSKLPQGGAMDVADKPAVADPTKDSQLKGLQDQVDKLTRLLNDKDVAKTREVAGRAATAPKGLSLDRSLNQTKGQCANGQCGR